mgnify:FL=1
MKKHLFTALLLFLLAHIVNAQEKGILKGSVIDEDNKKPVPGATISLLEFPRETQTENDGSFSIELSGGDYTLLINARDYR